MNGIKTVKVKADRKVIIVTGASSGIGKVSCRRLLEKGHTVYCAARRRDRMTELEELGGRVIETDVTVDGDLTALTEAALSECGRIDVLFNNAGYGCYGAVEDIPPGEARSQFDVNVFAPARLIQLVVPHMRRAGRGLIINTSSMAGRMYSPLGGWYHAGKYALEGLSDCLRYELKPHGIDVVLIEPGNIATSWNDIMFSNLRRLSKGGAYEETAEELIRMMARLRYSDAEVVAETVCRAVAAAKPKTRYLVGSNARLFVLLRNILPDRAYDSALKAIMKLSAPKSEKTHG